VAVPEQVNRRLESLEKSSGEGDPAFPKRQWPPSELCPLCRLPSLNKKAAVTWNEEEVHRYQPTSLIPLLYQLSSEHQSKAQLSLFSKEETFLLSFRFC
jgi:hypothetical protein